MSAGANYVPYKDQVFSVTPEEMYFFAKDERITIIPNFSLPTENGTASCIAGEFGPFQPNRECQVPLWLALTLWKRKRCSMRPPEWMDPAHLDAVLQLERQDGTAFQALPFHYVEIAHFLFTAGSDDALPREVFGDNLAKVKELVETVQKARMNKVMAGLSTLQGAMTVKLNNLAAMEINTVRPFFLGALDLFHQHAAMEEAPLAAAAAPAGGGAARGLPGSAAAPARQLRRG